MMQEKISLHPELENGIVLQAGYMVEQERCRIQPNGNGETFSVQVWEIKLQAYCNTREGTPEPLEISPWNDTKAFLASFEEVAEACQWPKKEWVARLQPALRGDAKHAYRNLDGQSREDYVAVKAAILRVDALKMEKQRQHFSHFSCQELEDPRWLHCQLQELCHQWLKPERRSKEQILELLILEQFLASLPPDIREWIQAKGPNSCTQAVTLVEDLLKPLNKEPTDSHNAEQEIQDEAKQTDDTGTQHWSASSLSLLLEKARIDEPELMETQTNLTEASDGTSLMAEAIPTPPELHTIFWEVVQENSRKVIALGDTAGNEAKANIQPGQNHSEEAFGNGPHIIDGIMIVKCEIEEENGVVGKQPVSEGHPFSQLIEGLPTGAQPSPAADEKDKMPVLSKYSRRYHYMPEFDTVLIQETNQESPESEEMFQPNLHLGESQTAMMGERRSKRPKYGSCNSSRPAAKEEPSITQMSGKYFGDHKPLRNNRRAKSKDQPYWCSQCGKNFLQKEHLSRHERSHSAAKPHECPQCGKHYIYKGDLTRHQLIHKEEKPFQCSDCGKRFNRNDGMTRHRKSHKHKKTSNPEEFYFQR